MKFLVEHVDTHRTSPRRSTDLVMTISKPTSLASRLKVETPQSTRHTEKHNTSTNTTSSEGALLWSPCGDGACKAGTPGKGGATLMAMAFFYRLRRRSMQRLQEGDNRSRAWRDMQWSGRQYKANRHGVCGLFVGEWGERNLHLRSDGIVYEHTSGDPKPKEIAFSEIAFVRAVRGLRSHRWLIKMQHGPDYLFSAASPKARTAWVWCVRNNVEAERRRVALIAAQESVAWRHVHSFGHGPQLLDSSVASPVKCRPITALPKVAEGLAEGCHRCGACGGWERPASR